MNKEGFTQTALASLFAEDNTMCPELEASTLLSQSDGTGREQAKKLPCKACPGGRGDVAASIVSNDH